MDNYFLIAGVICIIYIILKFIQHRFEKKEDDDNEIFIKNAIHNTILIYISSILALFINNQFNPLVNKEKTTSAFIGGPDF